MSLTESQDGKKLEKIQETNLALKILDTITHVVAGTQLYNNMSIGVEYEEVMVYLKEDDMMQLLQALKSHLD